LDEDAFNVKFIRKLIDNFSIGQLEFQVESESVLARSLQILAGFPHSQCSLKIWWILPETKQLLAIPPIKSLEITSSPDPNRDMFELFILLLECNSLTLFEVEIMEMTTEKLRRVIQMLSADNRERRVRFEVEHASMIRCLSGFGIYQTSKVGYSCDELEVMLVDQAQHVMHLRYRRSFIELTCLEWTEGRGNIYVEIDNCAETGQ
ncbi:hypothetical protein PMAYCL1PPCAC_32176, partial [Pristionchus mayeri]